MVPSLQPTSVEAEEALIAEHLLRTVKAVLVHQLPHKGPCGSLVLHTSLHQVDRVDGRRSGCYGNTNQAKLNQLKSLQSFYKTSQVSVEGMGIGGGGYLQRWNPG